MIKPFLANWLALLWALPVIAAAQTAAPSAAAPTTQSAPAKYRSVLDGYKSYTEEKTANWIEANNNTGRIGGWRVYAKEARQPQASDQIENSTPSAAQIKP